MEYYALASAVGVQLESERDGTLSEAQSSHPSSGFISARRRYHENLTAQVGQELKQTQEEKKAFEHEREKAAAEAALLKKSIEEKKAALGKVVEVRSSAEMSVASQSEREAAIRQSKNLR